jgi:hypothetical protein
MYNGVLNNVFQDHNLNKIPKNTNKNYKPYAKKIIFININSRKIKFISLDSSHQDDSNKPKMIKI